MKRIVSIQDISCFGKCSLTVALPIISAMGIEACPVPTRYFQRIQADLQAILSRFNERYSVLSQTIGKALI